MKIDFSKEIVKCYNLQNKEQSLKYSDLIKNSPNYDFQDWKEMSKTYEEMLDTLLFLIKLVTKQESKK